MTQVVIWFLIGIDLVMIAAFLLMFTNVKCERLKSEELRAKVFRIGEMLEEMVQLNESAFRNMSHTIRVIEDGMQKVDLGSPPSRLEKKRRILSLLNKGFDVNEITRRLNIPKGEVELVANLGDQTERWVERQLQHN